MVQKRKEESEFKVSDKRLFNSEGELRDAEEQASVSVSTAPEVGAPSPQPVTPISEAPVTASASAQAQAPDTDIPEPPSASEHKEQHDAYRRSSRHSVPQVDLT